VWTNQIGFLWPHLLLIFSVQLYPSGQNRQIDAMVCMWITLGCYGLVRFFYSSIGLWRWYYMALVFLWGSALFYQRCWFFCPLLMYLPLRYYVYLKSKTLKPVRPNILGWGGSGAPKVPVGVMARCYCLWFLRCFVIS